MQVLRIVLRQNVPLGDLASVLSCTSQLYRILSLAYDEQIVAENTSLEENRPWEEVEDLRVFRVCSGSILIDLAEALGASEILGKLVDWLRGVVDPYQRQKSELELERLKIELESQKLELESQKVEVESQKIELESRKAKQSQKIKLDEIEVARAGVELVTEALEMYDGIVSRNFPEPVAKNAFYAAVQCFGDLREIQERRHPIISVELIDDSEELNDE